MADGAIVRDIVATNGVVLVKCVIRWIYDQAAELLRMLKDSLMSGLFFIDRQIDSLRMILLQADILAQTEEFVWNIYKKTIEEVKNALLDSIPGPEENLCPEFYEFIMAPFNVLVLSYTDVFSIYRERWKSYLSYMDEVDYLISYWESTKAYLLAMVDALDDGIYAALERAATATEVAFTEGSP